MSNKYRCKKCKLSGPFLTQNKLCEACTKNQHDIKLKCSDCNEYKKYLNKYEVCEFCVVKRCLNYCSPETPKKEIIERIYYVTKKFNRVDVTKKDRVYDEITKS